MSLCSTIQRKVAQSIAKRRLDASLGWKGKIFCLGRNKTGTTTMSRVLSDLGYRVAPQQHGERLIYQSGFEPDERFWAWIEGYDAFQDVPFSHSWFLPQLLEKHGDARFVLTVRDPEDWYLSLRNHHFSHLGISAEADFREIRERIEADTYVAPGYFSAVFERTYGKLHDRQLYERTTFIKSLLEHQTFVRSSVPSSRLLEIDLSLHADTTKICAFLDLPPTFVKDLPRENRRR